MGINQYCVCVCVCTSISTVCVARGWIESGVIEDRIQHAPLQLVDKYRYESHAGSEASRTRVPRSDECPTTSLINVAPGLI